MAVYRDVKAIEIQAGFMVFYFNAGYVVDFYFIVSESDLFKFGRSGDFIQFIKIS